MTVRMINDGKVIRVAGDIHTMDIEVKDLPRWLKFYRELAKRQKGKYRQFYQSTIDGLERAERFIKAANGG